MNKTEKQFTEVLSRNDLPFQKFILLQEISHIILYGDDSGLNEQDKNLSRYIYSWNIFNRKKIPFELWSDICEEGLQLLHKLLEDPSVPYTQLPGFKEFDQKVCDRVLDLARNHPIYGERMSEMGY